MPFSFQAGIQKLRALSQLPSQLLKTRQAQRQAAALQARLAAQQTPQQQVAQPPVSPVMPPVAPLSPQTAIPPTLPPLPPKSPVLPQLEALRKQVEDIQSGLRTPAPNVTPAPVLPSDEGLKKAQEQLTALRQTTPEEETTEKQLASLLTSRELGLRAVEEKPIAMEFITGQQAALERRAATQAIPLQQRLAQLQAKRAAAFDVAKERLGFEEAREKRRVEAEKEIREAQKPFELSPGHARYAYNPQTGKYEKVAEAPPKAGVEGLKTSLTEVGGRRVLVNTQTGEIIKDLGISTKTTSSREKQTEISAIENRLIQGRRSGEFVDGNVYLEERRKSTLGTDEFDKRFGELLSPGDRQRYGIGKGSKESGDTLNFSDL